MVHVVITIGVGLLFVSFSFEFVGFWAACFGLGSGYLLVLVLNVVFRSR